MFETDVHLTVTESFLKNICTSPGNTTDTFIFMYTGSILIFSPLTPGHLCDPEEIPGLAHFCEHMLFLGTEKVGMATEKVCMATEKVCMATEKVCMATEKVCMATLPPSLLTALHWVLHSMVWAGVLGREILHLSELTYPYNNGGMYQYKASLCSGAPVAQWVKASD